jgi:hypothetical protein
MNGVEELTEQHPDKTTIGPAARGFDFLATPVFSQALAGREDPAIIGSN